MIRGKNKIFLAIQKYGIAVCRVKIKKKRFTVWLPTETIKKVKAECRAEKKSQAELVNARILSKK